jgi:nitroimidazol reductase NimA-like FMN-containing flavoprotein (pyridoxamine 5'-phosphate oxidase superfamily)
MPQTLSPDEIESLVHQQYIGRLGCHAEDTIYVVPISYAYDGVYIYGHSYAGTKINMMRRNPKVCLQVDFIDSMFNWQSAIAWGDFEELTADADRLHVQTIILNRGLPFAPPDLSAPDIIVFRIKVTKKTGCFNETVRRADRGEGVQHPV